MICAEEKIHVCLSELYIIGSFDYLKYSVFLNKDVKNVQVEIVCYIFICC